MIEIDQILIWVYKNKNEKYQNKIRVCHFQKTSLHIMRNEKCQFNFKLLADNYEEEKKKQITTYLIT